MVKYIDHPLSKARRTYLSKLTGPADVVMVGDSIFDSIEWAEELPDYTIANRSVPGETTRQTLNRLANLQALEADTYVVFLGTNDLRRNRSAEAIIQDIVALLYGLPGRKIVVGLLPCASAFKQCNQEKIDRINRAIAESSNAHFVALDKINPQSDFADEVHLNASGMRQLASSIRAALGSASPET